MLLRPPPSVLAYYSGLMLRGSEDDKARLGRTVIMAFLGFVLVSFFTAAHDGVFMSKTRDLCTVVDGLRLLVPMPERFAGLNIDLGLFSMIFKKALNLFRPTSRFVVAKRSIGLLLTLKNASFSIAGVCRR